MAYLTLVETAKMEQNPLRAGVIELFAQSSPILERLPVQQIDGNAYHYNMEAKLPGIAFRGYNETYTASTGVINPQVETVKILGGEIIVDKAEVKTHPSRSLGDLRASQTNMKVKAAAGYFTKMFFKGDSATDPRQFDGLMSRIAGKQLIQKATPSSGGDAVTLDLLDELIDSVIGGPNALFLNKSMRRRINRLMRAAGQAQESITGAFGQQIPTYAGIPMVAIEEDETETDILGYTEAGPGGGSSVCTSIYAIRFGADEYTSLLEVGDGIEVNDIGEMETRPAFLTRVEWLVTPAIFHGKAAARLWGLKDADA